MAYVGYNPQNVPVPPYYVNPPAPPCPPPLPPGPHGKFPDDGFLINYEGISSDTADVIVDNKNRTIKVDVNKQGTDVNFVYTTPIKMSCWEIDHNMNKFPSVTLVDMEDNVIMGEIHYVNMNKVIVNLSEAICGKAYLN